MLLKRKRISGAVLPIVLVVILFTQLTFFSVLEIYENQMETYILLSKHYQSRTLLTITESQLHDKDFIGLIEFNIGMVQIEKINDKTYKLTSRLHSGYTESKTIIEK